MVVGGLARIRARQRPPGSRKPRLLGPGSGKNDGGVVETDPESAAASSPAPLRLGVDVCDQEGANDDDRKVGGGDDAGARLQCGQRLEASNHVTDALRSEIARLSAERAMLAAKQV